jgi:DUF1365 family protein
LIPASWIFGSRGALGDITVTGVVIDVAPSIILFFGRWLSLFFDPHSIFSLHAEVGRYITTGVNSIVGGIHASWLLK